MKVSQTFDLPSRRNLIQAGASVLTVAGLGGPLALRAQASTYRDPMAGFLLGPGPKGRCDDLKIGIPVPYFDPKTGRWMMWYYCRDREFPSEMAASLGTGRVALAISTDGFRWSRVDGPLEKGAVLVPGGKEDFDSAYVGVTDVIRVGDRFWMYYFGADAAPLSYKGKPVYGYRMRPGLALSEDGINWTKLRGKAPGGAIIDYGDDNWASWSNGVHDGEKFALFHTTVRGDDPKFFHSHLAFSTNGVDWEDQGELVWQDGPKYWDGMGIMTRHVIRDPYGFARWIMLYTAMDARPGLEMRRSIAAAVSDDLKNWRHLGDAPIMAEASNPAWDDGMASAPHLVVTGKKAHLYYFGARKPDQASALPAGIGLAIGGARKFGDFTRISPS